MKKKFFKAETKNHKYRVEFMYIGKLIKINFGHKDYQHYKDLTPLKLYSHKDHNDKKR